MAKVSIGLRGWRFDEEEVFEPDGSFKPLEAMPDEVANQVSRLAALVTAPCDACYLIHGEAEIDRCAVAAFVYGEPMAEVLLCAEHEPDFRYWYREAGGDRFRGDDALRDEFHTWFADGNRAPPDYEPVEHVDTDPDDLPEPPDPSDLQTGACDVDLDVDYPTG